MQQKTNLAIFISLIFCFALCVGCKTDHAQQQAKTENKKLKSDVPIPESDTLLSYSIPTVSVPVSDTFQQGQTAPKTSISTLNTDWIELTTLVPEILLDMRYATRNNFVKQILYDCPKCFVKPAVAEALFAVQQNLATQKKGYRLKMYDCYRPAPVQQRLWEIVPDPNYVTPPAKGSMHNRGLAVDITLVDETGNELDMGTEFDFFGERAHFDFTDLPNHVLENRKLLRNLMEAQGFKGIRTEWWHFSLSIAGTSVADWEWDCE